MSGSRRSRSTPSSPFNSADEIVGAYAPIRLIEALATTANESRNVHDALTSAAHSVSAFTGWTFERAIWGNDYSKHRPIQVKGRIELPLFVGSVVVGVLEFDGGDSVESLLELPQASIDLMTLLGTILGRVDERVQYEQLLEERENRYSRAALGSVDGLWEWNVTHNSVAYSPRWISLLGYDTREIGTSPLEWLLRVHPDDTDRLESAIHAHLRGHNLELDHEHRIRHKNGHYRWMRARGLAHTNASSVVTLSGSLSDVTDKKSAERELEHRSLHDSLTGLANRALVCNRIDQLIACQKRRHGRAFTVLLINIDRFKNVNSSLGHESGDRLLIQLAQRIELLLRPSDTMARMQSDEFAIVLEGVDDNNVAMKVARRVQAALSEPFQLGNDTVFVTGSIGLASSASGYATADAILHDASTAMYRAKDVGPSCIEIFSESMRNRRVGVIKLESELRRAIERGELQLYFQPIVDLETGVILEAEALVRWHHPERGLVPPLEFIPLAEETGLIVQIGAWVLREACRNASTWNRGSESMGSGELPFGISVNLSPKQIAHASLVEQIGDAVAEYGLAPGSLTLEITESAIMEDPEAASRVLGQIRGLGLHLSIDDFGTGYSSLSYLHKFPLDTLKIDRSFVQHLDDSSGRSFGIVQSIVLLATTLGIGVVAEGIETEGQLSQLRSLGCDKGQGYLLSKPVPGEQFAEMLQNTRTSRWPHLFSCPPTP